MEKNLKRERKGPRSKPGGLSKGRVKLLREWAKTLGKGTQKQNNQKSDEIFQEMTRNPQCRMLSSRGDQDCSVLWIFKMEVFGILNQASK